MIKKFLFSAVIVLAMSVEAAIDGISPAVKSLNLDNNRNNPSELGGDAIPFSGDHFSVYELIRDSDSKYATKITSSANPYSGVAWLADDTTDWSYLAVVNTAESVNTNAVIWSVGRYNQSSTVVGIALAARNSKRIEFVKWDRAASTKLTTLISFDLNDVQVEQYHSYLITCTGNTYKMYVDGRLVGSATADIAFDRGGYQIGGVHGDTPGAGFAKGIDIKIDELAWWDVTLTDAEANNIAAVFPVWPRSIKEEVSDSEFEISSIRNEVSGLRFVELAMSQADSSIVVDENLPDIELIDVEFTDTLTIKNAESGISENVFGAMLAKFSVNGLKLANLRCSGNEIKIKENGTIVVNKGDSLTCNVGMEETYALKGIEGLGELVKTGYGTLTFSGESAIDSTTIKIEEGEVSLNAGSAGIALKGPTFIIGRYGELTSTAGMSISGILTLSSDYDKEVFANRDIWGGPVIVKEGAGRVKVMCGSKNNNGDKQPFSQVIVNDGTLAFGGNGIKEIINLEGKGTLEQAGGGEMTISKVSQEASPSLKVSAGTLNNECEGDKGSITLAGLEIAAGATYTMKPAIDHLNIAKSFYLEGDVHKRWYVTLENGALIATDPANPMVLNELEFKGNIKLGSKQVVGSVLAKTIKPANLDSITAKSENAQLNVFDFALDYAVDSIIVKVQNQEKMMVEAVPDIGLVGAQYRVYVPVPEGYEDDPGSIWVTVSNGGPTEDAAQVIKKDEKGRWYALIEHSANGLAAGNGQKIDIAVGYRDGANIVKVDSYSDVLVNVRPDAVNEGWINETAHERWSTGEWDSEGEYVVISNGYVQVASDNSVSFTPSNVPEEPEAESKIHFSVVFGEGMKLDIINALVDEDQFAGVGLIKEEETYQYCVIDPSIVDGDKYVNAKVAKQSVVRIDPKAEHLVEITINHAGNFISYSVDGATLTDTDGKAIFHLPAKTKIKIAKIDFLGNGAVKSMSAEEYSTKLAEYNKKQYATIEKAIIAAKGDSTITVTPLWDALWTPSSELRDKAIKFEGDYKVIPVVNDSDLAANNMVLDYDEATKIYKVISKFLTVSIPDPETIDNMFGVFLESVTTNSMHLGWVYEYKLKDGNVNPNASIARATVVYGDDVVINFSTTIENKGLLVNRLKPEESWTIQNATFKNVRKNIVIGTDVDLNKESIPVLDANPIVGQKSMAKLGVMKQDAARVDTVNFLDFTTASDGVTFTVTLVDKYGNDITKIVTEQIGEMVEFSTDLVHWEKIGADNVSVITNDDGVEVMFAQQKDTTSGFYKVVIPAE